MTETEIKDQQIAALKRELLQTKIELFKLTPDAEEFDIRQNRMVSRKEKLPKLEAALELLK
jgi:hypothetical protein